MTRMPRTVVVHYLHTHIGEITVTDTHAQNPCRIAYSNRAERIKLLSHLVYDLKRSGGSNLSEIAVRSRPHGTEHGVSTETFRVYAER